jgi:hypothetical protein
VVSLHHRQAGIAGQVAGGIQSFGSQVITFVTAPDVVIRGDVIEQLYEQLHNIGRVPQIDLFLHSTGGQTEIPWRLITLIREFCDRFAVLIPAVAYSAATHLAMGANEIVMGPLSELSPVDPARTHPLLPRSQEEKPPDPISVQDLRHCVEFIKNEINDPSPEAMAEIFVALFEKVHPLAIGAIQQSYACHSRFTSAQFTLHLIVIPVGEMSTGTILVLLVLNNTQWLNLIWP